MPNTEPSQSERVTPDDEPPHLRELFQRPAHNLAAEINPSTSMGYKITYSKIDYTKNK